MRWLKLTHYFLFILPIRHHLLEIDRRTVRNIDIDFENEKGVKRKYANWEPIPDLTSYQMANCNVWPFIYMIIYEIFAMKIYIILTYTIRICDDQRKYAKSQGHT